MHSREEKLFARAEKRSSVKKNAQHRRQMVSREENFIKSAQQRRKIISVE